MIDLPFEIARERRSPESQEPARASVEWLAAGIWPDPGQIGSLTIANQRATPDCFTFKYQDIDAAPGETSGDTQPSNPSSDDDGHAGPAVGSGRRIIPTLSLARAAKQMRVLLDAVERGELTAPKIAHLRGALAALEALARHESRASKTP